jgi:hypothetical protein
LADVNRNRISPVVAEALKRLGERVARLDAAAADSLV